MHSKLAFVLPAFVGIFLTSVLACSDAEQDPMLARAQVKLDSHRTLWEQTRSSDYTYGYNVLCECSDNVGQTVRASVTNGDIESRPASRVWSHLDDVETVVVMQGRDMVYAGSY